MPTDNKIDSVINAFEKANKHDIMKAISRLNEHEIHQLAKIVPTMRLAVASPEAVNEVVTRNKPIGITIPGVQIQNARFSRYSGSNALLARRGARVRIQLSDEQKEISKEEHEEINDKYAGRVSTPKEQYIKFQGAEHMWDLIMKDKEENGWKFKDEE